MSTAQLNAECDLKYSDYQWMYDPQEGTLLPLGNHCLRVDLCYFRDGDIHFLSKSVQITVIPNKFTPPPPLVSVLPSLSLSPSSRSHNGNQPVQTSPSSIGNIARRIFNWSPKNKTSPTAAENWFDTYIHIVYLLSLTSIFIHCIIFLTIYIHTYISIHCIIFLTYIHPYIHACT